MPSPINLLLENIGHQKDNIDFRYFATADTFEVCPRDGENREFNLLIKEEIECINTEMKCHEIVFFYAFF